jgi:hypothetical protein
MRRSTTMVEGQPRAIPIAMRDPRIVGTRWHLAPFIPVTNPLERVNKEIGRLGRVASGTRQPLEVLGRLDRHLLMLIPDTTARVGAWYPDNSLIRVDLPEPFWPEQTQASAGLMVG